MFFGVLHVGCYVDVRGMNFEMAVVCVPWMLSSFRFQKIKEVASESQGGFMADYDFFWYHRLCRACLCVVVCARACRVVWTKVGLVVSLL